MSDSLRKWIEMQNDERWTADSTYSHNDIKKDPIVESVINDMRARSRDGVLKYGTTLYDSPDGFYKWIQHAQEEAMDFILYLEKIKKLHKK